MAISGEKQPTLDVYARPFVPQIFRSINQAPANVICSLEPPRVDFYKYVQAFAGFIFLTGGTTSIRQHATQQVLEQHRLASQSSNNAEHITELDQRTYASYFQAALHQEAVAQQKQCEDHALYRAPVTGSGANDPRPNTYILHVPGLRETSLRIEVGDIVRLRQLHFDYRGEVNPPSYDYPEVQYDSVVWSIDRRRELLSLRIDDLFHMSMLFNVCFTLQYSRIAALHCVVDSAASLLATKTDENWMRSTLFPESTDGYYQKTLNKAILSLDLRDEQLNYEQQKAVNTVLNEAYGPVPFLISGPPGTGKTKTLVELALQKIHENQNEHLLLCAPSDPAADTLVLRLSKYLKPAELLRINSPARSFPEVPGTILPFCCVDDGTFTLPVLKLIMGLRIVVTTCRDAQMLIEARLSNSDLFSLEQGLYAAIHPSLKLGKVTLHWTSLLIDEAAQAMEPEALIPLMVIAPPSGFNDEHQWPDCVMAGDPHQLGPRTASNAEQIQTSLFERLLNRPFYHNHPLARSKQNQGVMRPLTQDMLPILRPAFANLVRNYRSHPAILATPSSLFYNDTLEPEATNTESLLSWSGWKRSGWPVLFAKNEASDEIEGDGGGWYNVKESMMAIQYARSFLESGLLQPSEICIMSPFQAQVRVLRKHAREAGMHGVNVGPLEAFQGLESRLVILCTTRTRNRFIDQDLAKGLGVIHEPKRFNVALTRAKEGLIIIGNPDVLKQDDNWKAFLAFCARNRLFDGPELKIDNEGSMRISRLEKQLLHREKNDHVIDGAKEVANGFRKLGFHEDAEQAVWSSGVEHEASLNRNYNFDEAAEQLLQDHSAHADP